MSTVFRLDLTFDEPTILTEGSSDASGGHETLPFIPGTTLLGALAAALGIHPAGEADLFTRVFLSDATRFLNAYPVACGERTLPRPRSFRQGKIDRRRVKDSIDGRGARVDPTELLEFFTAGRSMDRMKAAAPGFVLAASPGVDRAYVAREQVHVAIARERRAAEPGILFTYSSLPAGSHFRSHVITSDDEVVSRLERVQGTAVRLRVGRSRGGGYGAVTGTLAREEAGWQEYPGPENPSETARGKVAILTLLSDYLPPVELPVLEALTADLRRLVRTNAAGLPSVDIEPLDVAVRKVTGFRGVWGLPRAPRTAMEKGSVLLVHGVADGGFLAAALRDGLGGRRNEGFGRLALNWRIHGRSAEPIVEVAASRHAAARVGASVPGQAAGIVAAMKNRRSERQRRRFVEVALAAERTRAVIDQLVGVPPSQLGNLRVAMSSGLDAEAIGEWFADLAGKTAGERWRRVRVRSLRDGDHRRDGVGFVWTSLFGGQTRDDGRSDDPDGSVDFRAAVVRNLVPLCGDPSLHEAAAAAPDRTLRMFVIGLCGDVVRRRNLDGGNGEARE